MVARGCQAHVTPGISTPVLAPLGFRQSNAGTTARLKGTQKTCERARERMSALSCHLGGEARRVLEHV